MSLHSLWSRKDHTTKSSILAQWCSTFGVDTPFLKMAQPYLQRALFLHYRRSCGQYFRCHCVYDIFKWTELIYRADLLIWQLQFYLHGALPQWIELEYQFPYTICFPHPCFKLLFSYGSVRYTRTTFALPSFRNIILFLSHESLHINASCRLTFVWFLWISLGRNLVQKSQFIIAVLTFCTTFVISASNWSASMG